MLYGKLVQFRTMETEDLPLVKAVNDDPAVRGNVVGWGWPNSQTELQKWHGASQGGLTHRWVVEDLDGRVIGVTGLWDVNWHDRNALTALKLGGMNEVRGRGLGTDAIKLLMAHAFYDVGLNRLYGSILETNPASMRAYVEKCGWRHEGVSREHVWRHGRFLDLHQVGVLKVDFDQLPDSKDYVEMALRGVSAPARPTV